MKKYLTGLLIIVVAILLLVGLMQSSWSRGFPGADRAKWQAVFLANNQVYFGHVKSASRDYIALTDVFYIRAVQPLQQGSEVPPPQLSLVKLGNELHGPEDVMYIPKDNILFWENMKDDAQVVQAIRNFLAAQGGQQ